jgi:choice-of-anchor C domain-containing protein
MSRQSKNNRDVNTDRVRRRTPPWGRIAGVATWAALCMALIVPAPAVAAPFSNGGFESPGGMPYFTNLPAGSAVATFITSWTVTAGDIDYGQHPGGPCQTVGLHCIDLNGYSPGTIQQTFDTMNGATCTVQFSMARNGNRPASAPATLAALINGVAVASYTHNASLSSQWQPHTFTFVATGASTTLAFQSTTTTWPINAGPQIDNVMVGCVPPPPPGRLKVCKVAGPWVAVGTPFTFQAGTSPPFTVLAGPAPGGTCSLGPTFNVGSSVWVTETIPSGMLVSAISVAPLPRQIGLPNLAGGTVQVLIGSGVTDVTFTNTKQTGFIEICKTFPPTVPAGGSYTFTVNPGNLGPFVVPARSCSPAIEVAAGTVTITEVLSPGIQLATCSTLPTTQQGPCNPLAGTSTVNVVPGDVSTQTVAIFTNKFVPIIEHTDEQPE